MLELNHNAGVGEQHATELSGGGGYAVSVFASEIRSIRLAIGVTRWAECVSVLGSGGERHE
jgi:hypothetical protein